MLVIASTPANNTLEILLIFGNKKDLELQSYIQLRRIGYHHYVIQGASL